MSNLDYQPKVHVILVNDGFYLGGIEILETKLAQHLIGRGHKVTLVCQAGSKFDSNIAGVEIYLHNGLSDFCDHLQFLHKSSGRAILASFQPKTAIASLIAAQKVKKKFGKDLALFHWVSHSRAFFFSPNPIAWKIMKKAFFEFPKSATFFMNDAARDAHAAHWNIGLHEYPVLRIIGRHPRCRKTDYSPRARIRIVSVGRLVPFKAYNTFSPNIIRELIDAQLDVEWNIWGYGPDHDHIVERAAKLGVSDRINMKGELDHAAFDETVKNYDLFVGMGTAALEAAKLGIPTVLALENGSDRGYGFLSVVPGDTVGDKVDLTPESKIAKTILDFSRMTESERVILGNACAGAAFHRESDIDFFVDEMLDKSVARRYTTFDSVWLSIFNWYLKFSYWKNEKKSGVLRVVYSVFRQKF